MIIGRTSSGAINIKTDSPGLRAVECACCVSAVCGCMVVPANLIQTIESATQVSVNGISQPWNGTAASYFGSGGGGDIIWDVAYADGLICASIDASGLNTVKFAPAPFTADECWFFGAAISQNGSINGQAVRVAEAFPSSPLSLDVVFS